MKKKRIVAKPEVCVGCGLCRVNCIVEHSRSKNIIKAFKHEYPKPPTGLKVLENNAVSIAMQCRHCENPKCISACISGAIRKREDGLVLHNPDKCVGCYSCVMACPYGCITILEDQKKVYKCDLCNHRDVPACVAGCPNEALVLEEISEGEG